MTNYSKWMAGLTISVLSTASLSSQALAGQRDRPRRSTTVSTTTQTTHSTTVTTTRSHGNGARPAGGYHRPGPAARPAHVHPTIVPTRTVIVTPPPVVVVQAERVHYSGHGHHHHYSGCGCPGYEVEVREYHHHYYEPPAPRREVVVERHYDRGHSDDDIVAGACLGAGIGALFGLALAH